MNRGRILWVEDDPDDEELIRIALQEVRVEEDVLFVRDGFQALDYMLGRGTFKGRPAPPQVVILDFKLCKMEAPELLRRIRAEKVLRSIPLIVFSSSRQPQDVSKCRLGGAVDYVQKPTDAGLFFEAVRTLARRWLAAPARMV